MPRIAAALASLLLVASSIGVNIARYPNVGQTADPVVAAPSTPTAPAASVVATASRDAKPAAAPPEGVAAVTKPAPPAPPAAETNPFAPPAKPKTASKPKKPAASPADPPADTAVPVGHILTIRPLPPVENGSAGGNEVTVRLPIPDAREESDGTAGTSNADPPPPYLMTDTP